MDLSPEAIVDLALEEGKGTGADYADVRVVRNRTETVRTEDRFVRSVDRDRMGGFGVRVLRKGSWGFASSTLATPEEVRKAARLASDMAAANADASLADPVRLTEEEPQEGTHRTPMKEDPFEVPLGEKTGLLLSIGDAALRQEGVRKVVSTLNQYRSERTIASTEGTRIRADVTQIAAEYRVWAVGNGDAKTRTHSIHPRTGGYEHVRNSDLLAEVPRVCREAVDHLNAPPVTSGRKDLILLPNHLALTIHESVGHATELDRALGMEESLAGRTFAVPSVLGKLKYGSPLVHLRADNTLPGGLATMGWDDDAVPGGAWDIVRDGLFVGYSTNREVAEKIGETRSRGANRADSWASFPIVRIPNLSLMPGKERVTLDDLIADTKDGLLIDGRGSFSIDQMRLNFQFGGDAFFEIRDGKVRGMVRDVTYQAITPDFWNACDGICDERFFKPDGILYCGKGDPMQVARMTHGAAPARFRNIRVQSLR
ncbi:MAG: TldD/PmbA family protein [Planctomycetota bacterium]|jgi:TldD protein